MVNKPSIRPCFLAGVALGGAPLGFPWLQGGHRCCEVEKTTISTDKPINIWNRNQNGVNDGPGNLYNFGQVHLEKYDEKVGTEDNVFLCSLWDRVRRPKCWQLHCDSRRICLAPVYWLNSVPVPILQKGKKHRLSSKCQILWNWDHKKMRHLMKGPGTSVFRTRLRGRKHPWKPLEFSDPKGSNLKRWLNL